MKAAAILLALACTLVCGACTKREAPVPVEPAPSEHAADTEPTVLAHDGPADPRAARLCHALHGAPAERRAACCEEGAVPLASDIEEQCAEVLTAVLAAGDVTLTADAVASCELAQQDALEGCSWVRPLASSAPAACAGLFVGALDDGARCSTSLECKDGLRCHGASALSRGRCGKPKVSQMPCGAALDPLAVALGAGEIDARHPECEGQCVLGRCAPKVPVHTAAQTAVMSWRADEGDSCRHDLDCVSGGCVKPRGAGRDTMGTCAMKCRAL